MDGRDDVCLYVCLCAMLASRSGSGSHHRIVEDARVVAYLGDDRGPLVLVERVAAAVVVAVRRLAVGDPARTTHL